MTKNYNEANQLKIELLKTFAIGTREGFRLIFGNVLVLRGDTPLTFAKVFTMITTGGLI